MDSRQLERVLKAPPGPDRTAAIAEWFQNQYEEEEQAVPVLVGGAAVELFSGGAYTTGDLDFVGESPDPAVQRRLGRAGFERRGRHWVHPEAEIFIELPSESLDSDQPVDELQFGEHRLKVLAPEAVLVDRLSAWQHWGSSLDGAAAFLMYRAVGARLIEGRLRKAAVRSEVLEALERLQGFATSLGERDPSAEELETWSREIPE